MPIAEETLFAWFLLPHSISKVPAGMSTITPVRETGPREPRTVARPRTPKTPKTPRKRAPGPPIPPPRLRPRVRPALPPVLPINLIKRCSVHIARFARRSSVFFALPFCQAENIRVGGLSQPVEIIRDRWGVPHIYARTIHDLFFAQGYITAKDRLWQIDLWRRIGTGKLAEVLGPSAIDRDRLARAVRFRGDWNAEWSSYGPETREIVTAFTDGINAYIKCARRHAPARISMAGYDPGLWAPEDCLSRVAGLADDAQSDARSEAAPSRCSASAFPRCRSSFRSGSGRFRSKFRAGLDLADITHEIVRVYEQAVGPVAFSTEQGSNNWVVDGTMTVTGKPLLANDPHRPVQIPSLRKTVHLVGAGLECDRRRRTGAARHRARAQRAHRLRLHHRRHRSAGSLRGEAESGESPPSTGIAARGRKWRSSIRRCR